MTVDINLYEFDYSNLPKKTVKLDDEIESIRISPCEIAIITKKKFDNGETQTKVNRFVQEVSMYKLEVL